MTTADEVPTIAMPPTISSTAYERPPNVTG